ncbi:MAG: methylated-DNA--[protein]-cysteine S-methyltransferase [Ginsengibacter sp.]
MTIQDKINFDQVTEAIEYLQTFKPQLTFNYSVEEPQISSDQLEQLFNEWAGTTPTKFLQYISGTHIKKMLKNEDASLFETTFDNDSLQPIRSHNLFVKIEGMTSEEYANDGENLNINYSFAESPFGNMLVASTSKGICHLAFADDEMIALKSLTHRFQKAIYKPISDLIQRNALRIFSHDWKNPEQIKLHLKGTDFQLKVWETLLKIPLGKITTYRNIARYLQKPTASRAVGTAIGDNPVAFIVPCHRVIQSTGAFGGYHWRGIRKTAIIGWEAAQINAE